MDHRDVTGSTWTGDASEAPQDGVCFTTIPMALDETGGCRNPRCKDEKIKMRYLRELAVQHYLGSSNPRAAEERMIKILFDDLPEEQVQRLLHWRRARANRQ